MALGPIPAVAPIATLPPLPELGPRDAGAGAQAALPFLQALAAEPALEALAQAAGAPIAPSTGLGALAPESPTGLAGAPAFGAATMAAAPLPDALRLDPGTLQQLAWRMPDAARLAPSWQAALLQAAGGRAGLADETRQHDGAQAAATGASPGARVVGLAPGALPGWINVYAWGGMHALLGAFALDPEDDPPPAPPRRRAFVPALRFALEVPGLGRIHACLHLSGGAVALDLGAQTPALMQHVRACLPRLAAAFARAELRLARCRLVDLAGLERVGSAMTGLPASLALAPTLFRAATELWAVIAPPLAGGISSSA